MTTRPLPLDRLVDLRERKVDKLAADVAAHEATRRRFVANIERMQQLARDSGASGAVSPALAANCAGYKQSLLQLTDAHRRDLAAHELQADALRRSLSDATREHEVLRQVAERRAQAVQAALGVRERKQGDDLASQVWLRGRP